MWGGSIAQHIRGSRREGVKGRNLNGVIEDRHYQRFSGGFGMPKGVGESRECVSEDQFKVICMSTQISLVGRHHQRLSGGFVVPRGVGERKSVSEDQLKVICMST